MFIRVYVDDIIIIGSTKYRIYSLISTLKFEFAFKDLGQLHYFLGIEATHLPYGLYLF